MWASDRVSKVIHVTEAMSAGVLDVLTNLSAAQLGEGVEVEIIYCPRSPETPRPERLKVLFPGVRLIAVAETTATAIDRVRALRKALTRALRMVQDRTVVHLHSSYAGVAGRSLPRRLRERAVFVYSPHGFAHLREDKHRCLRFLFAVAESALARRGHGIVAVSQAEASLAESLSRRPVVVLANRLDLAAVGECVEWARDRPLIGNIGRVAPQKGFDRFARVARVLSRDADFLWIGGGSPEGERVLTEAGVTVTGWVDRATALHELRQVDLLLFPSRWEGMPIALMEAQAMGIPAVAYDCVGVSDALVPGRSGFIVNTDEEALDRTRELIRDRSRRQEMAVAAVTNSRRFGLRGYGHDALAAYAAIERLAEARQGVRRERRGGGG